MKQVLTHWVDEGHKDLMLQGKGKYKSREGLAPKPFGFWISVDNSWENWLSGNWEVWLEGKVCLKVKFKKDIKLFIIKSKAQVLKKFKELMGFDYSKLGMGEQFNMNEFHKKLKNQYDGIWLLASPFYRHRMDFDFMYFYAWDCESICVWNKDKIKFVEMKKMEKPKKTTDKEKIGIEIPAFIIDSSALKAMFEGKNKNRADDLLMKFKKANDSGKKVVALTPLSSFLRAIYLSDSKVSIGKIQKTLSFLQIIPSFADFKNKEAVTEELLRITKIMSERKDD